jgi:hypothetical protein
VSTITQSFYDQNLKDVPVYPVKDLLRVECANGEFLPYAGYLEVDLTVPGITGASGLPSLFLVVPDTRYGRKVPVLIGTNILQETMDGCQEEFGPRFVQKTSHLTPWGVACRRLSVQKREMTRAAGRVGVVKSNHPEALKIAANRRIVVTGFISDAVASNSDALVMLQATPKTTLPEGVEVMPHLIRYPGEEMTTVHVEIANPTSNPVVIQPRAVLCELQHVEVEGELVSEGDPEGANPQSEEKAHVDDTYADHFKVPDGLMTGEEMEEWKGMQQEFQVVFSEGDFDIGKTTMVKHRINLTDDTPFKQRHRRIPPSMYEEVRGHLQKLLDTGVIRESDSPYASGVVLVRKKNGKLRFCVDYRQLNQRTIKDAYALPRIEESLDCLAGSKYFSSLDLRSGYYQVEVDEADKGKTAFTVGPLGFYEWNRMPFGLSNAPATFQRLMERCMGEMNLRELVVFIDDLIVHANTVKEELARLRRVFVKLRDNKLKLNPEKCRFFVTSVGYLGHVVSKEGVSTDPDKTEKIKDWPTPKSAAEVREFLGFAGYYRKFVKGFASVARPLTDLLVGGTGKKTAKGPKME